jgi:hypothetical protein
MSTARQLRNNERDLIAAMLLGKPSHAELLRGLEARAVEDMQDGGMGSIRFVDDCGAGRHLGNVIAEAEYTDDDGVVVSIALNTDTSGGFYEVDFWKVDFSPLLRYPSPSDLRIK